MNLEIKSERCEACGIVRLNNQFYWSHGNTPASNDEVYNKVCGWAHKKGKQGCINTLGERKKGLGWGESLTEQTIFGDEQPFDSLDD